MQAETNSQNLTLREFLQERQEEKIPALPLEFEYLPVEVLSKEFTKLNSTHPYRVHYLGPRPLNTLLVHKRFGRAEDGDHHQHPVSQSSGVPQFHRYRMNLRKIINCNFTNERLQQNNHYRSAIFYRAFEGMNPTLPPQNELLFNSSFESGNLDCVIKVKPCEFDLFLRIDSNTRGHTSWYYFSIKNGSRMDTVTLNICNLTKPNTLYDQGLRPFVFSTKQWQESQRGWQQGGENCKFQQAKLRYDLVYDEISVPATYRLSFDYTFQHQDDEVFFAYCVPYTYSELQRDIEIYKASSYVKTQILGKSLTGVDLPIMHISNHQNNQRRKKNIVVTARVHPCETNSSHMLNGFIKFLLSDCKEAEDMRNTTNFFIVPMLNPDGVILGNTRTSAAGKDLNRQFMTNKKELYPEVMHIKTFTAKIQRKYGVFIYIDFHGHSRRKNTFLYGPNYQMSQSNYYKCRILPRLIEKCEPKFRFYSCSFMISEEKKTTARAVMLNQLKIPYSYTIQSSIGLYYNPVLMKTEPFSQSSWEQMGGSICLGLFNFVTAYIEYENMIKERRNQRSNRKEVIDQKQSRAGNSKLSKAFKEDQIEMPKGKKGSSLLEMLEDIKIASDQLKKFQEDVESDDNDENQDLQGYKLIQFNNMVTKGIQRQKDQRKTPKLQEDIDFEAIVFPSQEQVPEDEETAEAKPATQFSPKKNFQTLKYPRTEDNLRKNKTSSTQMVSTVKLNEGEVKRFSLSQNKPKNNEAKDKSFKNFVVKNKQRYSIATKNLFPAEDKCQILALPKNIQVMRKSMKKGRVLINNLEESRARFFSLGLKQEKNEIVCRRQSRIPFLQMQKQRFAVKSSTAVIKLTSQDINLNDFRIRKSQSHFHEDAYASLNGFQMDNRAMTITTFKQLK